MMACQPECVGGGRRRLRGPSAVAVACALPLAACSDEPDDRPTGSTRSGVTELVSAGPADDVVVEGDLFAVPARAGSASSMELCDRVGEVDNVPDVPFLECKDARVTVRSPLDLYLLDLGWQSADGFAEHSLEVEVTGDYDGEELVITEVRRLGEPVVERRPDVTDFTVPRGTTDLCDRVAGTPLGLPPANSTYVAIDGAELPAIVWRFEDEVVIEYGGDVRIDGTWSCDANQVRAFGTGHLEGWLVDDGGRLVLIEPDGTRYVEYDG